MDTIANWNIESDRPIYRQLVEQITQQIASGVYPPGGKLLPVRELASQAGVNPNTMQRALAELERVGLLLTRRTSGRFVTEDVERIRQEREQLARAHIARFLQTMAALGFTEPEIIRLLQNSPMPQIEEGTSQ